MGTGANMSTADKIAALAARRAELETLLAAKNEELYALCVQEVQLTGVVPPEAPLSPEAPEPRERRASVRSTTTSEGDADSVAPAHARRRVPARLDHKHLAHRLSTPSISGASVRSAHSRSARRLNAPPDTLSIPSSQTYPSLAPRREPAPAPAPPHAYRHHALTTDYMNKIYYTVSPDTTVPPRLRDAHFSSSHPDIATYHAHAPQSVAAEPRNVPLLYQYASQLKSQNQHLSGLVHSHLPSKRRDPGRRNTLQRTQTYHLTAHSDYPGGGDRSPSMQRPRAELLEHAQRAYTPMERSPSTASALHAQLRSHRPLPEEPPASGPVSPTASYTQSIADSASVYRYSMHEKPKEKHWYETSLDSPTGSVLAEPPPRPAVKRSPSIVNTQTYEIMTAGASGLTSPRSEVALESPKNCTVVEQGKWIPYREVTKPFEMSDFYKYSTKFRQANQKVGSASIPSGEPPVYRTPPEVPQLTQDHWHAQNH